MVSVLDRKLLRDLMRLKGQALTIALVVAVGVANYITLRSAWRALGDSKAAYYEEYRFADAFARLKRAPDSVAEQLGEVPGVASVYPRIVEEVLLPIGGILTPAQGQIVSLPSHGRPPMNDVYVKSGRFPEPGRGNEVLIYEPFAREHELRPGSTVPAILNGKLHELIVVGLALSPEYVFAIEPGGITSNDERFAPMWMSGTSVAAAFQMEGAFNDVAIRLEPGADESAVLIAIDRILEPYGGLGAYGRSLQISNSILEGELAQIEAEVVFLPGAFLAVAAFLLNVVFSRMVTMQRGQIAVIKAVGYESSTIAMHYFKMVCVIVLFGSAIGVALGAWLADAMLDLYAGFFRLPMTRGRLDLPVAINAVIASLLAAVAGIAFAIRSAVTLPPAEAMRPPSPARYRASPIEQVPGLRRLHQTTMMVFREIWRRPLRTLLSSAGIAFALAIIILGRFGKDAHGPILDLQFGRQQREDISVIFKNEVEDRSLGYLAHLPGVDQVDGYRMTPVRFRLGPRWRDTVLIGLPPDSHLRRLFTRQFQPARIPHSGVLLTDVLADILGAEPGDLIDVELKEGDRGTRQLRVSGTIDEAFGIQGYMQKSSLHELLREKPTINTALLRVNPGRETELHAYLTDIPTVQSIHRKRTILEKFEGQTRKTMQAITLILTLFATAIAVAVVYNNARVSLSVRSRDLATLRVLGFTRAEISAILLGEQAIQVCLGIPVGMALGTWGVKALVELQADPEQFRLPMLISSQTYAFSVVVVLAAAVLSALLVRRRLDTLDLIGVLKTRE
ncbi:MAG: FtsX-like permease family protein [Deltaproteobacteria bacterium]|nr:FtsX-like permease family protein [Deltaproteobacteria bacterium]MBT8466196.1 FtsX-like permease family protein [Deltaproteobacteria bacterium]NND27714.1 FtsX-like permease family protein [Myxococcales bacterium]NNK06649.1 FtsX-like permease family protein [Myxococcales bacterium]RZV55870.1 MAG: FtsX-like permease family protein [Deltaproteobacteria bacterium]